MAPRWGLQIQHIDAHEENIALPPMMARLTVGPSICLMEDILYVPLPAMEQDVISFLYIQHPDSISFATKHVLCVAIYPWN